MPILIVDDDSTIRDLTTMLLTNAGFDQVVAVESADQAFEILGINPAGHGRIIPDVILMDIMMPKIDGIEATAHIKLDTRFADVPILMVTSLKDIEHLKKAFMAGATDYMTKPIRDEELLARVRTAHRLKRELDRRKAREEELHAIAGRTLPSTAKALVPDEISGLFDETLLLGKLGWIFADETRRTGVLIVIGLDAWDSYQTRYGKDKCDKVMAKVAEALSLHAGHLGDQLVRLGDGRFAVFCMQKQAPEAKAVGDKLRAAISSLKIPHAFSSVGPLLTASAGAAAIDNWQGSRADLLAETISLMGFAESSGGDVTFTAKQNGK